MTDEIDKLPSEESRREWKAMTPQQRRERVSANRAIVAAGKAKFTAMMDENRIELGEPALSRAREACENIGEWDALSEEEKGNRISHYRAVIEAERQEREAAIERAIETGEI